MSSAPKPSLQGAKTKLRKGVQKARAKFEPNVFRDEILKHLQSVPAPASDSDQDRTVYFDAIGRKLDELGATLDFHRYDAPLLELLFLSRLLAPGGNFLDDGAPPCPFSVITSMREPVEQKDAEKVVEVLNKLIRRYKYLQKPLEETTLRGILQYANKFPQIQVEKLGAATAILVSLGLANPSVVSAVKKDHLVKDGSALHFLTWYIRAYLARETVDHLSSSLKRTGNADLLEFFPQSKRSPAELAAYFDAQGLKAMADIDSKAREGHAREEFTARFKEMVEGDDSNEEIIAYLAAQRKSAGIPEGELMSIVFNQIVAPVDIDAAKPDQVQDLVIKQITQFTDVLEGVVQNAKAEVALINGAQVYCFDNMVVSKAFPKILRLLYSKDVLSAESIIFWHAKGSKPAGRETFRTAAEPLVKFLQQQQEEESEEED